MEQSNSKALRQRVINLLYLVFLAFIFILIPSDFVDSTFHSNQSLEQLTAEIDKLNTTNNLYFLTILKNDEAVFEDTRQKFIKIEELTALPLNTIERYKKELINMDGISKFGYYNKGKSEVASTNLMIYKKKSDTLLTILRNFKINISDFVSSNELDYLDKLLPLKDFQLNSDGQQVDINKFFFSKSPLNISVMNLSHFASRVQRIKIYTLQKIIKQVIREDENAIPLDLVKIMKKNPIDNSELNINVAKFYEQIKKEFEIEPINKTVYDQKDSIEKEREIKSISMSVESITDSVHPIGKPIKFNIVFDDKSNQKVNVTVKSKSDSKSYTFTKPSDFVFFPSSKGSYKFSFDNGFKKITKDIRVIDIEPIIQNTKLPTLYIGIDNPLKIVITEYGAGDNLVATISDGVILKKGDVFYARFKRKGIVKAEVFVNLPYGKVKVAEQQFMVRELQPPIPYVNTYYNGTDVISSELKDMKKISLKTDEFLVNEEVYVAEFDFMKIYNEETSVSKPIKNVGSSFNTLVLKMISNAKPGDIFIFSNIKTKSSLGTEKVIAPLTLKIK
jgi:hypothetical protein